MKKTPLSVMGESLYDPDATRQNLDREAASLRERNTWPWHGILPMIIPTSKYTARQVSVIRQITEEH